MPCLCLFLPLSDAAGHNGEYLRAGLDHLSRHRGKQGVKKSNGKQLKKFVTLNKQMIMQ